MEENEVTKETRVRGMLLTTEARNLLEEKIKKEIKQRVKGKINLAEVERVLDRDFGQEKVTSKVIGKIIYDRKPADRKSIKILFKRFVGRKPSDEELIQDRKNKDNIKTSTK